MLGGFLILLITGFIAFNLANSFARPGSTDNRFLKQLFVYHVLLSVAYYFYILFNASDSRVYYDSAFRTSDWISLYGTSTTFIKFLNYPWVRFLGFSYEAAMALFSFFGYLGFAYFYLLFREQIKFKHDFMGMDLGRLIFLLPNLHFWSGSLGKGSVIFLGIAWLVFGLSQFRSRILYVVLGGLIVYHVRPHIMLVMLVSFSLAFVFTAKGISLSSRVLFLGGAAIAFFFIYRDVLTLIGISEDQMIVDGLDLTHRASELSKATSGIDITNYSLPMQVFTFLYRPLFFDAPGALGFIVSFENVFYILITLRVLLHVSGWRFLAFGSFISKGAFLSFLSVSIALAQISGNLGLAIRQKSQVMILFMFVILAYLDDEKRKRLKRKTGISKRIIMTPANANNR